MIRKVEIVQRSGKTTTLERKTTYTRLDDNLTVPTEGRFVQFKHWRDLPHGADNIDPYPEIIDKGDGLLTKDPDGQEYDYVELEDRWQWFLWRFWDLASQYKLPRGMIEGYYQRPGNFRTFAKTTPGSLTYVYVDMVEAHRAFAEAGSPEAGSRDAVTGRNLTAKKVHGLPVAGTPSPFFSLGGTVKILRSSCVPVNNGDAWTPYAPL